MTELEVMYIYFECERLKKRLKKLLNPLYNRDMKQIYAIRDKIEELTGVIQENRK